MEKKKIRLQAHISTFYSSRNRIPVQIGLESFFFISVTITLKG